MMEIRKELASLERQLSVLMKKDGKAEWYKKKSTKKIKKSKDPAPDTQRKIPFLLKSNSSTSSSTDDSHNTLTVCSDSSMENELIGVKLLGVTLDDELSFDIHVDNICKKLSQRIAVLCKIKRCLPLRERCLYYNAMIKPIIFYGSAVWTTTSKECWRLL